MKTFCSKYGFNYGFNDIKYPYAYDQTNNFYMLDKKSTFKDEYSYLYRNDKTNGKNLRNYKFIHK